MEQVQLMNMCKIVDQDTGKILIQERIKSWQGIAFPGGKIEEGEGIVDSVKREIYEETGLHLKNLKIRGVKQWYDKKEKERYLIFLFISTSYTGRLTSETSEGKVYWLDEQKLLEMDLADDFDQLLKVFNDEKINELVYEDNEDENESSRWNLELY